MPEHFINTCPSCGDINTCRCISKNKIKTKNLCVKCKGNKTSNKEPLLREPEHQTLQSMEFDKNNITNENELSTYPKNKERSELERIDAEYTAMLKEDGLDKKFAIRKPK